MNKRRGRELFCVACMTVALLPVFGCSVGLFFEGMRRDNETPDLIVPPESIRSVDSGATIEVFLSSGSPLAGVFLGMGSVLPDEYRERYKRWRASLPNPASVPLPGDELAILKATDTEQGVAGTFLGLDPRSILILRSGAQDTMNLWSPAFSYVFDSQGKTVDLAPLRMEMTKGTAPTMSMLRLDSVGVERRIPLGDVEHVRVPVPRVKKWIGLGVGALVDIVIVVLAYTFWYIDFGSS